MDEEKKSIVMCIDDERTLLDTFERDLHGLYELYTCADPLEALELKEAFHEDGKIIDLYVIDYKMPGMNGLDLAKYLGHQGIKILLTVEAGFADAIQAIDEKCLDAFVQKPYQRETLVNKIQELLVRKTDNFYVTFARTPEERKQALKTHNTVFSKEHLGLPYEEGIKIIGESPYTKKTDIFVAILDREMVGTTSISRRDIVFAEKFNTYYGLPIEEFYDIKNIIDLDKNLSQLRNAAVIPELQGQRIGPAIWTEIYRYLTMNEPICNYVVLLAASGINDVKKAEVLFQKIKDSEYFLPEYEIKLKNEYDVKFEGDLTNEDIKNAVMNRNLELYSKMNFRFIGKPVYYSNFRMFDFPMLLEIKNLAEPYKTWFEKRVI